MAERPIELKHTGYEIFMAMLSILSIFNIAMSVAFITDKNMQNILLIVNGLLSLIFLGDFVYRISTSEAKGAYFFRGFGWADLLSSMPLTGFKVLRLFRLIRVYRLLHAYGGRNIGRSLVRDRAGSALFSLLFAGVLVLEFGSLAMLRVEQYAHGANITDASAALWYVIVTISTVGYGDTYPVTNAGRLIGAIIIIVGVGIFGTFTGYLANFFLSPRRREDQAPVAGIQRLEHIKQLVAEQQAEIEAMEQALEKSSS